MSLPHFYAKSLRTQMLCHPRWLPGEGVVPGDIGIMRDGVFQWEGSYSEYTAVAADLAEEEIPTSARSKFSVGVTMSLSVGGEATIDPNAKVGGKLAVRRGGGVLLHVPTQRRGFIRNLREVLGALPWGSEGFGKETVLVSEVRLARAIALVVSETGDTSIDLTGKATALQQLDIADASVTFGGSSEAVYATSVGDPESDAFHPYGMLLYKARSEWWQDGKPVPLEAGRDNDDPMWPFVEVSPYDDGL